MNDLEWPVLLYYVFYYEKLKKSYREGCFKVEYHANQNPLKISEKIAYVDQQLMYPMIKKTPYHAISFFKCH